MAQQNTQRTEVVIEESRARVWMFLSREQNLRRLCEGAFHIDIALPGKESSAGSERPRFAARVVPHDVLLSGTGCSIAMRLVEEGAGCRLILASSHETDAAYVPQPGMLDFAAKAVKQVCEREVVSPSPCADADPARDAVAPDREETAVLRRKERPRPEPETETEQEPLRQPEGGQTAQPAAPAKLRRAPRADIRAKIGTVVLSLLIVAAVVATVLFSLPSLRRGSGQKEGESVKGYAASVTLKNALKIEWGSSRKEVEKLLGTDGVELDGNRRVYAGGALDEHGACPLRVCVEYGGDGAGRVTILNLDSATMVGAFTQAQGGVAPEMSVEEVAAAVGMPASMIRLYRDGENEIREVHFGYVDPFANFDPAWRGEFVVTQNVTQNTVATANWVGYDGDDPLMVASLEDHPLSNQYDSYTDFLNDKYMFERSFYMLNRFSIGDARTVFGEMTLYSTDGGIAFYNHDSAEQLPGGEGPLYRMMFGFDSRGGFIRATFANMRLFNQSGMLRDSDYAAVTRGMSYGEVRALMRIMPTMLIVDKNYFTLCYGRRLDTDIFEQQFEFIVQFDIENNYAQSVYTNMAGGAVSAED